MSFRKGVNEMGIPLRIRFCKLNRKMEKWKNGKMEFLCKSNAKKLASFAETPPKIMGAAHKNGKKATVNDIVHRR